MQFPSNCKPLTAEPCRGSYIYILYRKVSFAIVRIPLKRGPNVTSKLVPLFFFPRPYGWPHQMTGYRQARATVVVVVLYYIRKCEDISLHHSEAGYLPGEGREWGGKEEG